MTEPPITPVGPPPFPQPLEPVTVIPPSWPIEARVVPPPARPRWVLAGILFVLTFFTTTTLGAVLYVGTRTDETTDLPMFLHPRTIIEVWTTPALLRYGLSFSLPLLAILAAHELGHYFACRRYGVASTTPYFLPAPVGMGTFGAFIRIRARIATKAQLFDIGIAGPFAGFVVLIPFLVLGVAWSQPAVVSVAQDLSQAQTVLYRPGTNLAVWLLTLLFHGRLPPTFLLDYHPFALASWVGLVATALNLLPMGQLDGGHVLYAVTARLHRRVAWLTWLVVLGLGYLWLGWLIICLLVLAVMGLRHPPVLDADQPLDRRRLRLAALGLVLFALCFTPIPLDVLPLGRVPGVMVLRDGGAALAAPVAAR